MNSRFYQPSGAARDVGALQGLAGTALVGTGRGLPFRDRNRGSFVVADGFNVRTGAPA
jgi:hypothetical protein